MQKEGGASTLIPAHKDPGYEAGDVSTHITNYDIIMSYSKDT